MSVYRKTQYLAEVTWLGHVPASKDSLRAEAVETLDLGFAGDRGARHEGENRPSCSRVTMLYPKGTEIRNVRQLTILSAEEMADIAEGVGLDVLDPRLLGASIVLKGIPDFTHVPPSSRLQAPAGAREGFQVRGQRAAGGDRMGRAAGCTGAGRQAGAFRAGPAGLGTGTLTRRLRWVTPPGPEPAAGCPTAAARSSAWPLRWRRRPGPPRSRTPGAGRWRCRRPRPAGSRRTSPRSAER